MRHNKQNINNNLGNWTCFKLKRGRDWAQLNNYNVIEREHNVEGYEHQFLWAAIRVVWQLSIQNIGNLKKQQHKKR